MSLLYSLYLFAKEEVIIEFIYIFFGTGKNGPIFYSNIVEASYMLVKVYRLGNSIIALEDFC